MNFYRFFSVLFTLSFVVLFVVPVWGQNSFDPTRSTEPGYRFGFGDGREQQVVEQARKNAAQEAAKQGVDLQFQDPAKLRNQINSSKLRGQIRELGNPPTVSNDIALEAKDPGAFYVCVNKNGNLQKQIDGKKLEKQKQDIIDRYTSDRNKKLRGMVLDGVADKVVDKAEETIKKAGMLKYPTLFRVTRDPRVMLVLMVIQAAIGAYDLYTSYDDKEESLEKLNEKLDKNNSTETASQESFHYHFYGYRGQFDTGFDETGIHNIGSHNEAKTGNYTKLGGEYEVSIMREANQLLSESGQWTAQSFDARKHNSDHFMSALIKEYDKILRRMQEVTDELFSLPAINSTDLIATAKSMNYRTIEDAKRKLAALPTKEDLESDHCPDDFVDSYDVYVTAINENGVMSRSNQDARTRFENTCKSYNIKYPSRGRTR